MTDYYRDWFGPVGQQEGLQRPHIRDPQEIHDLTSYFAWAAWVCADHAARARTTPTRTTGPLSRWPATVPPARRCSGAR